MHEKAKNLRTSPGTSTATSRAWSTFNPQRGVGSVLCKRQKTHPPCADTCFVCVVPAVAEEPGPPAREEDSLRGHGVLFVHHPAGDRLRLAVPARSRGPPAL